MEAACTAAAPTAAAFTAPPPRSLRWPARRPRRARSSCVRAPRPRHLRVIGAPADRHRLTAGAHGRAAPAFACAEAGPARQASGSSGVDTSYVFNPLTARGGSVGSGWFVAALRRIHAKAMR
jgi:hypothetical protein